MVIPLEQYLLPGIAIRLHIKSQYHKAYTYSIVIVSMCIYVLVCNCTCLFVWYEL